MVRHRRDSDETDYLGTLEDLDSRIADVFTLLDEVEGKVNALNDSYDSFEASLDNLEETAEGKYFFSFSDFHIQPNVFV